MKSFLRKIRQRGIIRKLTISNNSVILDTSCQDGGFLSILLENNKDKNLKVFGVDMSETEILRARKMLPNSGFEITDNKTLPFPDKNFDIVVSSLTLHHMNDPIASIKEMKRVLRDTGTIYIIDVIAEGKLFNFFLKKIRCPEPYHFEKFYSLAEVQDLIAREGLKINSKKKVCLFPTLTIVTSVLVLEVGR